MSGAETGENLVGPYPRGELSAMGIGERDRFILKAVDDAGAIRFNAELVPRNMVSAERQRTIRAGIERSLAGYTPDDDY